MNPSTSRITQAYPHPARGVINEICLPRRIVSRPPHPPGKDFKQPPPLPLPHLPPPPPYEHLGVMSVAVAVLSVVVIQRASLFLFDDTLTRFSCKAPDERQESKKASTTREGGGGSEKEGDFLASLLSSSKRQPRQQRERGQEKEKRKLLSSLPEEDCMTHVPRNKLRANLRQRLYSRSWFAVQKSHHKSNNKRNM